MFPYQYSRTRLSPNSSDQPCPEELSQNWSKNIRASGTEFRTKFVFVRCSAARARVNEVSLATAVASAYTDTRGRRCKSCVAWKLKRERSVSSATSSTKYGGSRGRGRMRLVGASGFDGGAAAAGGFPPARESCTNTLKGRRAGVDKSNAPNATIFCHSLYYRRSEPRSHVRWPRSFPLHRESGRACVRAVREILSRGRARGKGNIVGDERSFPLILSRVRIV